MAIGQTLMLAEIILYGEMTFPMTVFFSPVQSSGLSQIDMVC